MYPMPNPSAMVHTLYDLPHRMTGGDGTGISSKLAADLQLIRPLCFVGAQNFFSLSGEDSVPIVQPHSLMPMNVECIVGNRKTIVVSRALGLK